MLRPATSAGGSAEAWTHAWSAQGRSALVPDLAPAPGLVVLESPGLEVLAAVSAVLLVACLASSIGSLVTSPYEIIDDTIENDPMYYGFILTWLASAMGMDLLNTIVTAWCARLTGTTVDGHALTPGACSASAPGVSA